MARLVAPREAAQVEPGAFAGDGAGEYRGHPDNWAKQGAAAAPNGGDPDGPAHAPVDKDAPYDMPSIPRAGATDADFAAGTTVERVVGHDEWRALVPEMVAVCFEAAKRLLKPWEQILEPPLSADYVAERIGLGLEAHPPAGTYHLLVSFDGIGWEKGGGWTGLLGLATNGALDARMSGSATVAALVVVRARSFAYSNGIG